MVFRERTFAVLLVSKSDRLLETTRPFLPPTDYWPVVTAHSAGEARRMLLSARFDIVIIRSPLPDEFGTKLAVDVCRNSGAGVLLVVKQEAYDETYNRVMEYGVMVLSATTSPAMVHQTLRMLCAARERLRHMEKKQATVEEKIEEIRAVNRAKWLLIQHLQMTEGEAHRYIEKQAMDLRISRRQVAENIMSTYLSP